MDSTGYDNTPWALLEKREVGEAVVALANKWRDEQRSRYVSAEQGLRVYYATTQTRMSAGTLMQTPPEQAFQLTPARSICDTAVSKIASKQRPRAVAMTTGGTYAQKLQAKKVSKWMLAMLHKRQGQYANTWALGEQVFRDCTRWEAGIVKVIGDDQRGEIDHRRVLPWDVLFDEYEAESGSLHTIVHLDRYDRWNLATQYPEHADQIHAAAMFPQYGSKNPLRNHDMVCVYDAYRLPFGKGKPGRHIRTIDSPGAPVLIDEPWEHNEFPFAFQLWSPQAFGVLGDPLVQQLAGIQEALNDLVNDLHENVRLQSGGYVSFDPEKVEIADIETNLPFKLVPTVGDPRAALNVVTPPPFHPAMMQFMEFLRGSSYEYTGISETSAQARKEPGIDAAVALRTMNDLQSERFLTQARSYEQLFVTIGRLDLMIASDMAKRGVAVKATFPDSGGMDEIDFTKVQMPEDTYVVTLQAASATEDTLAGRKQMVAEMLQRGAITQEQADELLASSSADTESLTKRQSAQSRYIERLIAKFQEWNPGETEAEVEEELGDEDLDDDESEEVGNDEGESSVYEPPDPVLFLPKAILQMSDGLIEMLADGAPERNKGLVRRWITEAQTQLTPKEPPAPAGPPAPPIGPGGGMPAETMPAGLPAEMMAGAPMPMPGQAA